MWTGEATHATLPITAAFNAPAARVLAAHVSRDASMRRRAGGDGWETFGRAVDVRTGPARRAAWEFHGGGHQSARDEVARSGRRDQGAPNVSSKRCFIAAQERASVRWW
jgi:uncharacterized protein YndB with AHSA1/START domain